MYKQKKEYVNFEEINYYFNSNFQEKYGDTLQGNK